MPAEVKSLNKKCLRHNEYYNIQEIFDDLYIKSKLGYKLNKIYEIIISRENILLAYRNIKSNRGSKTKGTNNKNILDIGGLENDKIVEYVRHRLENYQPSSIRRKYISKKNGKMRSLGIPTIEDRLIQQCLKQVLEPIVEAKFHNDSYGFRPNRSTHNAMAKCYHYINIGKCNYVVDVDINGFFEHVNHGKLMKQLWNIGIKDKRVLCIIGKMLRTEIEGEGIPNEGITQVGILSPLLANVVLNELDWWIDSQWLGFQAKQITNFGRITDKPYKNNSNKFIALKRTNLKPCFIVRYADDFKIFTDSYENAMKLYHATKDWLKERLKLEIRKEKSKVVNLKTSYSEFLGFKIKVKEKTKDGIVKRVVKSSIADKEKERIKKEIKSKICQVCVDNTPKSMYKLNALILGTHNYFNIATNVNKDFNDIENDVIKLIRYRWKKVAKNKGKLNNTYMKFYGDYKHRKTYFVHGIGLYPISGIKFKRPTVLSKETNSYTKEGREKIHKKLEFIERNILSDIMNNPIPYRSVEYNDNRISLFSAQCGRCAITGIYLEPENAHCHHKIPVCKGGSDKYNNLIFVHKDIHLLIHSNKNSTQDRIIQKYNLDQEMLKKINKLRKLVGNYNITGKRLITN